MPIASLSSIQRRYFSIRKYCGSYAIFEYVEEGGKKFERKVADDIEDRNEASLMAAALGAFSGGIAKDDNA